MGELKSIHKRADGTYLGALYEVTLPRWVLLKSRDSGVCCVEINRRLIETQMWPGAYGLWIRASRFERDEKHTRFLLLVARRGQEESQIAPMIAKPLGWEPTDRRIKVKLIMSTTG